MPKKIVNKKGSTNRSMKKKNSDGVEVYQNQGVVVNQIILKMFPHLNGDGTISKGLTMAQACKELDVTPQTINNWRRKDATLDKIWQDSEAARKEYMRHTSMTIIEKALYGDTRLKPKEQIDIAFRALDRIDPVKNQLEVKNLNVNIEMTSEELKNRIMELSNKLYGTHGINNSGTATSSESVGVSEDAGEIIDKGI